MMWTYFVGPDELSMVEVKAVTDAFGSKGIPKGDCQSRFPHSTVTYLLLTMPCLAGYTPFRSPSGVHTLISMNGETHEKRRRLWLRGMNHQSLDEYEGIIVKRTNQLLERLEQERQIGRAHV